MSVKGTKGRREKVHKHASLSDEVTISVGMNVMVTYNIQTELDIANRSQGEITDIVIDKEDTSFGKKESIITVNQPPAYVLVKLDSMKSPSFLGLEKGVIPITLLERMFYIVNRNQKKKVTQKQIPLTAAYVFTDY